VCGIHRAGFGCLFKWRRAGNSLRILAPRNLDLPGRANILETAPQQPQSPPSEEEREQQRCSALLRDDGPQPRSLLPVERAEIGRFLKTNHSLAQFRHDGIERLLGNASVLPDGRALFVFSSQPRSQIAISFFAWGSHFGACLRGMVRLRAHGGQVALAPGEAGFEALKTGKVVLAFIRLGGIGTTFELDYGQRSDHVGALNYLLGLTEETHRSLQEDGGLYIDEAFVRASSVSDFFSSEFGRLEWLQRGWLKEAAFRLPRLLKSMEAFSASCSEALSWPTLKEFGDLYHSLSTVAVPGSPQEKVRAALGLFSEPSVAGAFMEQAVALYLRHDEIVPTQVRHAIGELGWVWQYRELDPIASDWGRRQIYFDGGKCTIDSYPLNPAGFPIERDEIATEYWTQKKPALPFDAPAYLTPEDFPANLKRISDAWDAEKVDIDIAIAEATIERLLEEASALRQWTIPPRAYVELRVGPFVGVELTEVAGEEVYSCGAPNLTVIG
jgi:hypothetical protein